MNRSPLLTGLFLFSLLISACATAGQPAVQEPSLTMGVPTAGVPTVRYFAAGPTSTPGAGSASPATETIAPSDTAAPASLPTATIIPTETSSPPTTVRFAVIGDYGLSGQAEADVAALIKSWEPDLIITVGDNNYPDGAAATIDENIGQYYQEYIFPYVGTYGSGAKENRFFPSLGNHDLTIEDGQPYLDYFTLPGNERYYDFTWGPVHFFVLNGDPREPDGVGRNSAQAAWLQERLTASTAPWRVVYMHQPPYSSGLEGSIAWMQWPFVEWGATAVMSGHQHSYERILRDGIPFFINGLGGGAVYYFTEVVEGSQVRYNEDYGALLVDADERQMSFQFINRQGTIIDSYTQTR